MSVDAPLCSLDGDGDVDVVTCMQGYPVFTAINEKATLVFGWSKHSDTKTK